MRKLYLSLLAIISLATLNACITLDDSVSIDQPKLNAQLLKPNVANDSIRLSYDSAPSNLAIYLNGQGVEHVFIIGSKQATAALSELSEFLKQGKNTLSVNPMNFGPNINFIVDTEGPRIVIKSVSCDSESCLDANDTLTINGIFNDPSSISSASIESLAYDNNGGIDSEGFPRGVIGSAIDQQSINISGKTFSASIRKGEIYRFNASDSNGYSSETLYLAGDQEINPIIKTRIGDSALSALAPTVAGAASNMNLQALDPNAENYSSTLAAMKIMSAGDGTGFATPANEIADIQCSLNKRTWNPGGLYADIVKEMRENCSYSGKDGDTMYMYIGELVTDKAAVSQLGAAAGNQLNLNMLISDSADNNSWGTRVKLREQRVSCKHDLYLKDHWKDGWLIQQYWYTRGVKCSTNNEPSLIDGGLISLLYGSTPLSDGYKYAQLEIDNTTLSGKLGLSAKDGFVRVNLDNTGIKVQGLDVEDNILGPLISMVEGILEPIIKSVMQSTLDNALQKLAFPITVNSSENGTAFFVEPKAYQIYTQANTQGEMNLYAYFTGVMKADEQSIIDAGFKPSDIATVLGSLYSDTELPEPAVRSADANLEVGINANFINQGLLSLYKIGMTHIGIYKNEAYFGPNATDNLGSNNDSRIRLIPTGPGTFSMAGSQAAQASLRYTSATLSVEKKRDGVWQNQFSVNVDIEAGVLMNAENDKFYMTLLSNPDIQINSISNNTIIPVSDKMVQSALDVVFMWVIPMVTESTLEIDLPDLENANGSKLKFKTKNIQAANGRHLNFAMELYSEE